MSILFKNSEVVCQSHLQWTTFCQNSSPWPIHLEWPYSIIELDKAVIHVIRLVSFFVIVVFILSSLWWRKIRGLWKLPDGRDWLRGMFICLLSFPVLVDLPTQKVFQYILEGLWTCCRPRGFSSELPLLLLVLVLKDYSIP